ncbi:MAG: cob(I)yrinic acid a,c-diamide adenosyltransferase [Phascolarctobacterium sp.]|uniref:cob(I)yrinic acid a,c-diamide adenosyltransferase n=1 Tax=Phascolarctobacterium sp. TaxID=2049039 RepID=UPI0025EA5AF5|nr:cob(I)yrinic acid a,c-diamide adenosyltransferase [Phascolarctobacterium sp.]MCC8158911.1 cob(I)yrinic acid a,c-diamide adenosyltransferase [Phascolarctobacterium sp.]
MKGYGLLQVYTGTGKGKTTAALGVALRAAGRGAKTIMLSFLKDDPDYGEALAAAYLPNFLLKQVGRDAFVNFHNPDPADLKLVRDGWEEAKKIIVEGTADLLILDELNIVLATGMLPEEEVIGFLKKYKGKTEIITTGRGAPEALIAIADLVTEMQEVKHYFHKGVSSRDGIDH